MIEYSLTEDDWVQFQEHHARTSLAIRHIQKRNQYLVAAIYLVLGALLSSMDIIVGAFFVAVAAAWFLAYPRYAAWVLRRRARAMFCEGDNRNFCGAHRLSLDGAEMVCESPAGSLRIRVPSIVRLESTARYLFVYFTATGAVVIPRAGASGSVDDLERTLRAGAQLSD
jgi:hypothetical protein